MRVVVVVVVVVVVACFTAPNVSTWHLHTWPLDGSLLFYFAHVRGGGGGGGGGGGVGGEYKLKVRC